MTKSGDPTRCDVVVIGGGLQGLSSAYHLAKRGLSVTLLEAEYCGRHASGVNAGGVRSLGRHVAEIPISLMALDDYWHRMPDVVGHDCGFVGSGQLQLAENEAEMQVAAERVALLNSLGFHHEEVIDAAYVRKLVPSISPHVQGGIWAKRDGYALPFQTVVAFKHSASQLGAHIQEQSPVLKVESHGADWVVHTTTQEFRCGHIVNTAGAWANGFARQLGEETPAETNGLMLMVTQRVAPFVRPTLGALGRPLSFKQFDNGTVVIGGSLMCEADEVARCADANAAALYKSAQTVTDLFPHLTHVAINRVWAGVEAFMPDSIPVISPSSTVQGVTHAFGFSAHGFQLSPAIGRLVSELVCDGRASLDLRAFSITRFQESGDHSS